MQVSESQMKRELYSLWDNTELYNFVFGKNYISEREQEICKSIKADNMREKFIIDTVISWSCSEKCV